MNYKKNFEASMASLVLALQHGADPQRVARAAKAAKLSGIVVRDFGYGEFAHVGPKTRGARDHSLRARGNRRKARRH